jgi:hypothetical protein
MFATFKKNLIPEPRQADQPRRYVGRHRRAETAEVASAPVVQVVAARGVVEVHGVEAREEAEAAV